MLRQPDYINNNTESWIAPPSLPAPEEEKYETLPSYEEAMNDRDCDKAVTVMKEQGVEKDYSNWRKQADNNAGDIHTFYDSITQESDTIELTGIYPGRNNIVQGLPKPWHLLSIGQKESVIRRYYCYHHCNHLDSYDLMLDRINIVFLMNMQSSYHNPGNSWFDFEHHRADSSPSTSSDKDDSKAEALAIMGLLALVAAAIASMLYSVKKLVNSFQNLLGIREQRLETQGISIKPQSRKVIRSAFRLLCTAAGIVLGCTLLKGAAIGAALGSAVPFIGTAAGAVIGAICLPLITAGAGSLFGKYSAKLFSWCKVKLSGEKVISPTCPEKWRVSDSAKKSLKIPECTLNRILVKLRASKNETGTKGSFFWTKARDQKDEGNRLLARIKQGDKPESIGCYNEATGMGRYLVWWNSGNQGRHWTGKPGLAWDNQNEKIVRVRMR